VSFGDFSAQAEKLPAGGTLFLSGFTPTGAGGRVVRPYTGLAEKCRAGGTFFLSGFTPTGAGR